MMMAALKKSIEEVVPMQPKGEPDLEKWLDRYKICSSLGSSMIRLTLV